MAPSDFLASTRIIFGSGSSRRLPTVASALGKSALVATGKDPSRWHEQIEALRQAGVETHVFPVAREPEIAVVEAGVFAAKENRCDMVISIGGGSAIDAGKAIAAMLTNPGEVLDYLEVVGRGNPLRNQAAPFIAVPTTAGTGSEVTRNAVLSSPRHRVKASLRSALMTPAIAVVDPELTIDLSPRHTAATGMDALTQLIEPFVSWKATPVTDMFCREGLLRAASSLKAAFENGSRIEARANMSLASLYGGIVLSNAGLGAVHGFAGPIGGMFDAPHGAVCATLLPYVMETNIRALETRSPKTILLKRYDELGSLLTGRRRASRRDAVSWAKDLVQSLHIPGLGAYGIKPADISKIVEHARNASSMKANPITLSPEELASTLEAAL
jgi:alcohol dehydrogenase class IV